MRAQRYSGAIAVLSARVLAFTALVVLLVGRIGPAHAQRTVFVHVAPEIEARGQNPTPPVDLKSVANLIHRFVNEERSRHGLGRLDRDHSLERISRRHSRDMADNGYFDHTDLTGRNATQRANAQRYVCLPNLDNPSPASIGENLFAGFRYSEYRLTYYPGEVVADFEWLTEEEFAREAVRAWMDSPPHRANLLHPDYHSQGIGIYLSESLEIFVTQNLC